MFRCTRDFIRASSKHSINIHASSCGDVLVNRTEKINLILVMVSIGLLASLYFLITLSPQTLSKPYTPSSENSSIYSPFYGEIDATCRVSNVIDGDTFDTTSGHRIRLADIDAPEFGGNGYYNAKNFLGGLVSGRTVYLDIDDEHQTDTYGRLVCVAYVYFNSTHFKNVNEALLTSGYASISNYDNEFSPYAWTLYCSSQDTFQNPNPPAFPQFMSSESTSSSSDTQSNTNPPSDSDSRTDTNPPPDTKPTPKPKYVGSKNSNIYHYPTCYWAKKIKSTNEIWFTSSSDARAHGYRPCKVCNPP